MEQDSPAHSWFEPTAHTLPPQSLNDTDDTARLWQTFMMARLALGLVLLALQAVLMVSGASHSKPVLLISGAYFVGTLASLLLTKPGRLGKSFNRTWLTLVGLDLLAFSALQFLHGSNINYTPLFALPILLASVLGSLRVALGTAAGISVLLLLGTLWNSLNSLGDPTPYLVQAALSGVGYFAIALLANQLSYRLVSEGRRAKLSQQAARLQQQVNELVIESLPDGVLIVDHRGSVRAANPAGRALLGSPRATDAAVFDLRDEPGWLPLLDLMRISVGTGDSQEDDVAIHHAGDGPRRLRARTRLAAADASGASLCVIFLQDLRELEARMRTEKLASMGRMSTAVAHEIRNPLAAITQANALLDEDLNDPRLKKLSAMVTQNAKRLDRIVDDILNVSRVQPLEGTLRQPALELDDAVQRIGQDWAAQNGAHEQLQLSLHAPKTHVRFDSDHLRRVLVNLLDNAHRYTGDTLQGMQISTQLDAAGRPQLAVWSHSAPLDQSIERHLFEPFFSSESRSSGLGLYICRELCASHAATIQYQRSQRAMQGVEVFGNEFLIGFADGARGPGDMEQLAHPWQQPTLH